MWLSSQRRGEVQAESLAEIGSVSLSGTPAGVYVSGERRNVPLCSPGGVYWSPRVGEEVLLLACGAEGEPFMIGRAQPQLSGLVLAPGEAWFSVCEGKGIHLRADGRVDLIGEIYLNGVPLVIPEPEPLPPIVGG